MNISQKYCAARSAVALTGAAGFIGSHIASALVNAGIFRLTAIDNLSYGSWQNISVAPSERIKLITADLAELSTDDFRRHLEGHDILLHVAAEKHNSAVDSRRMIDVNISATARLFDGAGLAGIKKVIFTSSLYAYGRLRGKPMRERDLPAPATLYGISKLAGEGLMREASLRHGFDYLALRLFFVYGPRQFAGRGYPSVIVRNFMRILKGEPPVIFGDGLQVLDYVNIHDVVRAIHAGIDGRISGEIFNVGSGVGVTVNDLTEAMLKVAGSGLKPTFEPPDWTAGTRRLCDPSKIRDRLGWTPEVSLEHGLNEVWSWIKAVY